jgi:hypothetical protein
MSMSRLLMTTLAALVVSAGSVSAQSVDTVAAQGAMFARIEAAIEPYARDLGLDRSYVVYCNVRMHLDTEHETDGWVPYGVNYNNIRTQRELDNVIATREAFETNYLRLCLANARASLDAAQRR